MTLIGTVAVTDYGWYATLLDQQPLDEVNFWKPSATRATRPPEFSPFLFKLKSPYNTICGFGYFAAYSRLPDWLAWDTFKTRNGCNSLAEMRERIAGIRDRIRFQGGSSAQIGCVLVVQPTLFPQDRWVPAPRDWPPRTQVDKRYDLSEGEGARVWQDCLAAASQLPQTNLATHVTTPDVLRYGAPQIIAPRLGQGTFRIAVTEAYRRGCAVTAEHSLPALEAAHIKRYADDGPHEVPNGILLRADLHRLFDKGYVTISTDGRFEVSQHLRRDFENGRSYYPLHGRSLELPTLGRHQPAREFVQWHNTNVYLG